MKPGCEQRGRARERVRYVPGLMGALAIVVLSVVTTSALTCDVSSTGTAFGTYNPVANQVDEVTTTITVTCSTLLALFVNYSITITAGHGVFADRLMLSGANPLHYNLYADAARTQVLGDGNSGTVVIQDGYLLQVLGPVTRTYTIYGLIPAGQPYAHTGSYADGPTIILNYSGVLL